MQRAVAVGLIALSTGIATTASQCPTTTADECRDLSWRAGSVVLGVTLATSAQAWLQAQDDEVKRLQGMVTFLQGELKTAKDGLQATATKLNAELQAKAQAEKARLRSPPGSL